MNTPVETTTVSVTLLSQMFLYLTSRKVDVDAFLRSLGIAPSTIKSPDEYISVDTYLRIQDSAAEYVRDPCFGLHMGRNDEHTRAVTKIILSRLDDEDLSIKKVAKEMLVSVRTLQNRLEDEGIVFSDLLRDIREKLAKKYLRENYTVEQITYLLGFSEPSVFRKAFKKWSGVTPREYREQSLSNLSQV